MNDIIAPPVHLGRWDVRELPMDVDQVKWGQEKGCGHQEEQPTSKVWGPPEHGIEHFCMQWECVRSTPNIHIHIPSLKSHMFILNRMLTPIVLVHALCVCVCSTFVAKLQYRRPVPSSPTSTLFKQNTYLKYEYIHYTSNLHESITCHQFSFRWLLFLFYM